MGFRQYGQSDERRRRVLLDEREEGLSGPHRKSGDASEAAICHTAKPRRNYAETAQREKQLRIIDLIPKRYWTLSVLFLLGVLTIVVIEALFIQKIDGVRFLVEGGEAFEVTGRGTLGGWFASMLHAAGAAMAILIYVLRRHKSDDYRGRYRMWIGTSVVLLLVSINASTHFHLVISPFITRLTGSVLATAPDWWWMAVCLMVGLLGFARIAAEMRNCRTAVVSLSLALVLYGLAVSLELGAWATGIAFLNQLYFSASMLFGHLMLSFSLVLNARFVYFDAQGSIVVSSNPAGVEVPPRPESNKATKKQTTQVSSNVKTEEVLATKPEHDQSLSEGAEPEVILFEEADQESPASPRKLTKAERRRLRKQQRQKKRVA